MENNETYTELKAQVTGLFELKRDLYDQAADLDFNQEEEFDAMTEEANRYFSEMCVQAVKLGPTAFSLIDETCSMSDWNHIINEANRVTNPLKRYNHAI